MAETPMQPLVLCLATQNRHKVEELLALLLTLAPDLQGQVKLTSLAELGITDEVVEDGETFADNALIKAKAAWLRTGLWSLSDDSGLMVDALCGKPGIHSARWGGEPRSDRRNIDKLLSDLHDVPDEKRQAQFVCTLCLYGQSKQSAAPQVVLREGICKGTLRTTLAGTSGFGYDPLFVPTAAELANAGLAAEKYGLTYAELPADDKNRLSHRTRAVLALLPDLRRLIGQLST
ncbi:MAG TPA: non-canonical purine NTP pyrophosphatase [Pseudomonadota bacterium]|nr:non-canonical purine NTP pyrophosphatase [Pseudomonadota bacterium]